MDFKTVSPAVGVGRRIYIETYGCQMNVVDSETVMAIMTAEGFGRAADARSADVVLLNTCSIREGAEQRVWHRLDELAAQKRRRPGMVLGLIGCMAERLAERIVAERPAVDVVAGPDAYRSLPALVGEAVAGGRGVDVELSREETYAEISPVRLDSAGVGAFVAIMRGCDNFCSYCVVPYTRGRERSRDPETIVREARGLFDAGRREVTLLGQNVNSYSFRGVDFPELLGRVAAVSPLLRVRFATSHPKDISDRLLDTMSATPNICRAVHLPAQSGSSRVLGRMNRRYTREWYLERVAAIRRAMPDAAISTDLIAGFCGETPEDHAETLSLMREAGYDFAFMFKYSEREGTLAAREMADDVPDGVKTARLNEIIALQNELSLDSNRRDVGREFEILVEGTSKRSADRVFGRTSQNKVVVIDRARRGGAGEGADGGGGGVHRPGDYVRVRVTS
ncbi:MAG: tRNA (N6-isopentenyl adenosine(37)-C2)-methylthiotransferase MiaB, partial [Alistipes sp.]|nr:tRNA (N6-isopentenyl adenosine(37)-C2)-methylthiotransferase MiaB [Alistipes sp.]